MKEILFKLLVAVSLLIGNGHAAFAEKRFQSWEQACSTVESLLAEGDLIFLDIPNLLFRQVAAGTDSWTSHVGIAFKDENGDWIVAESTVPLSRKTPLCAFLSRSSKHIFEVKRLSRPLTTMEINVLRQTASSMMNRLYNLGFDFDSKQFFCSKFVYLTFQSIGIEVGHLEEFRQLLEKNPDATLTFWKLWFIGSIPWNRRTVTPASQLNDSKLFTVLRGV